MRIIPYFFIIAFTFSTTFSYGGKIDRAFEALEIYNYFKAKELFQKLEENKPSVAKFGLSIIYYRNDNPFHNLDSAYAKIVKSTSFFNQIKERKLKKYCEFNFDYSAIIEMRAKISAALFQRAVFRNTENDFIVFLSKNPWSNDYKSAVHKRDSLAFITAKKGNQSGDYKLFIKKYPNAVFFQQAQQLFYEKQYAEATQDKTITNYALFVKKHPESPYNKTAQNKVFELSCAPNTVKAYKNFIQKYPTNTNLNKAWHLLYRRYLTDFSTQRIIAFEKDFPNYPFKDELLADKNLVNKLFLPYNKEEKWGYINQAGKFVIAPKYDGVGYFKNGIAIVSLNEKLGYINKRGENIVEPQFDEVAAFHNGLAVFKKDELYGLIDQTGVILLEPIFKDISFSNENLFFAKKDSLYACYNAKAKQQLSPCYTGVTAFKNGKAIVAKKSGWGIIDSLGKTVVPFQFEKIQSLAINFLAEKDNYTYFLSPLGDTLFFADSVEVSAFSEGFALIFKNHKIGVINQNGEMVVDFKFDDYPNAAVFGLFKNGHAKMYDAPSERFGLIDTLGNWSISPQFKNISFYSEIIAAKRYKYWEYWTAASTHRKWTIKFANAESFIGPSAVVIDENKYGLFGKDGQFILPAIYDEIIEIHPSLFRLKDSLGYIISDKFGKIKLKEHFDRINLVAKNILRLNKNKKLSYYLIKEERLITIKDDKL